MLGLLYDRLVYIDQTGRPRPWLAESWSVDKDGREVTFVIRKGVTFTDGTPLDAEAVRYSLDRYLKISKRNADLGPVQKIEVVGAAAACGSRSSGRSRRSSPRSTSRTSASSRRAR